MTTEAMEVIEKDLKENYPDSTEAECFRFVQAAKAIHRKASKKLDKEKLLRDTASEKLGEYLEWRTLYGTDYDKPAEDADDKTVWDWAARKALLAEETKKQEAEEKRASDNKQVGIRKFGFGFGKKKENATDKPQPVDYDSIMENAMREEEEAADASTGNNEDSGGQADTAKTDDSEDTGIERTIQRPKTLRQIIFRRKHPETGEHLTDKNGADLIHVLPARIDRFAADNETWATAVALYIEASVDRNSKYTATIFVDARAGEGWPNPVLIMVVSLIGQIVTEINERHPERCKSLIIFPLPRALTMVWGSVKGFFGPEIQEMMTVFNGASDIDSPFPRDRLEAHVEGDTLDFLERCRTDLFEPKDKD
mmetsp:Transcript_10364/g.30304  ORF Transcript_10364/g.30304 Transcript_10364/m.30304 type:complete len:367 (+) Transcript_10364:120-1220(+)